MAIPVLLQSPRTSAYIKLSHFHDNASYSGLQVPYLRGIGSLGVSRRRYGVFKRKTVLLGFRAQSGRFSLSTEKVKNESKLRVNESGVSTGTRKLQRLPGTGKLDVSKKDNNVVFVAGATGKVGSRVVRELLKLGFQVRAGVRDVAKGQALLEMADEVAFQSDVGEPKFWPARLFGFRSAPQQDRVELVECNLEQADEIEEALSDAGVVVCAIGASEKEVWDVTGPYRIDFQASKNLIDAATSAKVNHFILVTSLGTTKLGWPASVLNLFWGVLIWKAKAEKALEQSGIPYTIVRPGGMERPTDTYKETHNLVLSPKDSLTGGQVSSLQIAELIASCVSNVGLAKNKVLEAVAETTSPVRPIEELLADIPIQNGDATFSTTAKSENFPTPVQLDKASQQQEDKMAKKSLGEDKKKEALQSRYQSDLLEAREKEEAAKRAAEEAVLQQGALERRMAELRVQAPAAARAARTAKALASALVSAAQQGRRLSDKEKREIVEAENAEVNAEEAKIKVEKDAKATTRKEIKSEPTNPAVSIAARNVNEKAAQAAKVKEENKLAKATAESDRASREEADRKKVAGELALEVKAEEEARTKATIEAEKKRQDEEERQRVEKEVAEAQALKARTEEDARTTAFAEAKEKSEKERTIKEKEAAELQAKAAAEAKEETKEIEKQELDKVSKRANREEVIAREREALRRARAASAFFWSWKKPKVATAAKGGSFAEIEPVQSKTAASEEQTLSKNKSLGGNLDLPPLSPPLPLSPSTRYPSLKPPTSPTPRPPEVMKMKSEKAGAAEIPSAVTGEAPKLVKELTSTVQELVANTEDKASVAKKAAEEATTRAALALEKARAATSFRWPRQKLAQTKENERPPLSTTFAPPTSSSSIGSDSKSLPRPSRPLSPYTRYPGLKPPSSPIPSPPKVTNVAASISHSQEAEIVTAKEGSNNDKQQERVLETISAGFKWPWQA